METSKTKTQLQWVKQKLKKDGFITRNEALRNYISRLSARILDLRKEGLHIIGERVDLGQDRWDYKYKLIKD